MFRFIIVILSLIILIGCDNSTELLPQENIDQSDYRLAVKQINPDDNFWGPIRNLNRPLVKVFYIESKDNPPTDIQYKESIDEINILVREVQDFFASELDRHGYGRKTFSVFEKDNKIIINKIKAKNNDQYYEDNHYATISYEMNDLLGNVGHHSRREIWLFFTSFLSKEVCGFAGPVSVNGKAYVFSNCYTKWALSHELGHAFGLSHDWRNGEFVMSYGFTLEGNNQIWAHNPQLRISKGAAGWLSQHKAFNENKNQNQMHSFPQNFRLVNIEKIDNQNKYNLVFKFDIHNYRESRNLNYGVLLNTSSDQPFSNNSPTVISFINDNNFSWVRVKEEIPIGDGIIQIIDDLEYTIEFETNLPDNLRSIQIEFLSKNGHTTRINSYQWNH